MESVKKFLEDFTQSIADHFGKAASESAKILGSPETAGTSSQSEKLSEGNNKFLSKKLGETADAAVNHIVDEIEYEVYRKNGLPLPKELVAHSGLGLCWPAIKGLAFMIVSSVGSVVALVVMINVIPFKVVFDATKNYFAPPQEYHPKISYQDYINNSGSNPRNNPGSNFYVDERSDHSGGGGSYSNFIDGLLNKDYLTEDRAASLDSRDLRAALTEPQALAAQAPELAAVSRRRSSDNWRPASSSDSTEASSASTETVTAQPAEPSRPKLPTVIKVSGEINGKIDVIH